MSTVQPLWQPGADRVAASSLSAFSAFVSQRFQKNFEDYEGYRQVNFLDTLHFSILVNGSPQVMLLAVDLYEDFINVEGIAKAAVAPLQSACINGSELDTPEADGFSGYSDAPLG